MSAFVRVNGVSLPISNNADIPGCRKCRKGCTRGRAVSSDHRAGGADLIHEVVDIRSGGPRWG